MAEPKELKIERIDPPDPLEEVSPQDAMDSRIANWAGTSTMEPGAINNGTFTNSTLNGSSLGLEAFFGDGSDGDVVISGTTNLAMDMFYDNLVVTGTLNTNGYRVFVKGTLSGDGVIANNGPDGGDGADGGAVNRWDAGAGGLNGGVTPGNSVPPGTIGEDGGIAGVGRENAGIPGNSGTAGTVGDSKVKCITDIDGVAGAKGGDGNTHTGGTGGPAGTKSGTILNKIRNFVASYYLSDHIPTYVNFTISPGSGSGGGGGGGDSTCGFDAGGGGGGGASGSTGGITWISAKAITFTGVIEAKGGLGGDGGDGKDGNNGVPGGCFSEGGSGGGGGGGGNGGYTLVMTSTQVATYTTDVNGGVAGTGGIGGASFNGGQSQNGSDGNDGNDGLTITLVI